MKAAVQLLERLGATVVGQPRWFKVYNAKIQRSSASECKYRPVFPAGVAAVAIENTEGGKWLKENYKFSHCIPEELQSHIDQKCLESLKSEQGNVISCNSSEEEKGNSDIFEG